MGSHLYTKKKKKKLSPSGVGLGLWVMSLPAQTGNVKLKVCCRGPPKLGHRTLWERGLWRRLLLVSRAGLQESPHHRTWRRLISHSGHSPPQVRTSWQLSSPGD